MSEREREREREALCVLFMVGAIWSLQKLKTF